MDRTETQLEHEGEAAPVVRDPVQARQGSRTKVNFVILIVSTLVAAAALFVLFTPALRL